MDEKLTKLIAYKKSEDNSIALIIPAVHSDISVNEIARKDTPAGLPYLIVDRDSVSLDDLEFFEAWEADFSVPDGYGIGADAWFAEQAELKAQAEAAKQEVEDDNNQPE
jgi:hypothetical protein